MRTPDEILFALRPTDDSPSSVASALEAIRAFEIAALDRAAASRARHSAGLLKLSAAELIALEGQARAEETAAAHAGAMIEQLEAKHTVSMAHAAHSDLAGERAALEAQQNEFAAVFHPRYAEFVAFLVDQFEKGEALKRATIHHNHRSAAFMKKCEQVGVELPAIEPLAVTPICKAYFERIVLPRSNLDHLHARWTPLAIAGGFWVARDPEGMAPASHAAMNAQFDEINAQIRAAQAERVQVEQTSRHEFETQNRRTAEREAAARMSEAADAGPIEPGGRGHFLDRAQGPGDATAARHAAQAQTRQMAAPRKSSVKPQTIPGLPAGELRPVDFGTAPVAAGPGVN